MICWRSKKQKYLATSLCKSEYMALALGTKQWIWLMNTLEEFIIAVNTASIFCDNNAAIDIVSNHKIGDRSKHIDIA
jgi:hypothetical protein